MSTEPLLTNEMVYHAWIGLAIAIFGVLAVCLFVEWLRKKLK